MLAYLRKGDTYAELAAGFGVGTATAWRYVTETVALLAARSPRLRQALDQARQAGHAYVIIDGTLILIDRVAADRPCGRRPGWLAGLLMGWPPGGYFVREPFPRVDG